MFLPFGFIDRVIAPGSSQYGIELGDNCCALWKHSEFPSNDL